MPRCPIPMNSGAFSRFSFVYPPRCSGRARSWSNLCWSCASKILVRGSSLPSGTWYSGMSNMCFQHFPRKGLNAADEARGVSTSGLNGRTRATAHLLSSYIAERDPVATQGFQMPFVDQHLVIWQPMSCVTNLIKHIYCAQMILIRLKLNVKKSHCWILLTSRRDQYLTRGEAYDHVQFLSTLCPPNMRMSSCHPSRNVLSGPVAWVVLTLQQNPRLCAVFPARLVHSEHSSLPII